MAVGVMGRQSDLLGETSNPDRCYFPVAVTRYLIKERRVSVGSQAEGLVYLLGKSSWREPEGEGQMVSEARRLGARHAGPQCSSSFLPNLGAQPRGRHCPELS